MKTPKTLFLYEEFGEGHSFFFEKEGNYSKIVEELPAPSKDWDFFVRCGFAY